jgi:preprotein translocase subunit Sss1
VDKLTGWPYWRGWIATSVVLLWIGLIGYGIYKLIAGVL